MADQNKPNKLEGQEHLTALLEQTAWTGHTNVDGRSKLIGTMKAVAIDDLWKRRGECSVSTQEHCVTANPPPSKIRSDK